jgi:uncharacterized protein (TIGR01244 family)
MSVAITHIVAEFSCAPQISVEDVAQIAGMGFKTIVNCRPDGEGGSAQPSSDQIRIAAERQGLEYFYFPIAMGTPPDREALAAKQQLSVAPRPILGFCKSGKRAAGLYQAIHAQTGQKKAWLQWLKRK